MDLENLRAFVETVRRGSFSLAAEALNLTQPAVSRRIARLEAEVGQQVLDRLRPVATPTRAGLALFTFAEKTLAEWDRLLPSLPVEEDMAGTLHVAASSVSAEVVLPPLVAEFCRRHAACESHLHVMNSDSVEECVRRRHCDIGFLGRPPRSPTLQQVPVGQDEVVLALPPAHALAGRAEVGVQELAGEAFVVREPGSGTWDTVLAALAGQGRALPPHRVVAEVSGAQAQLAAIAAGQGIGFISLQVAQRAARGAVAHARLQDARILRTMHMIYDGRRLSRVGRAFVDFVQERPAR